MLKDRLSPAEEALRDKEMQETLAACPRILDLVARGPLADPNADAVIYLRCPARSQSGRRLQRSSDGLRQSRRELFPRAGHRQG